MNIIEAYKKSKLNRVVNKKLKQNSYVIWDHIEKRFRWQHDHDSFLLKGEFLDENWEPHLEEERKIVINNTDWILEYGSVIPIETKSIGELGRLVGKKNTTLIVKYWE